MADITLYDYHRSTAAYRVRIVLGLAGLSYQSIAIDLLTAEHKSTQHLERNPQGLVPVVAIDGNYLTQSLAIIRYLNSTYQLGLLPDDHWQAAQIEAAAFAIAMDIHPICNLSVMRHATGGDEPARANWMQHFIRPGLEAFEALISAPDFKQSAGAFCAGAKPSLADICLIPQLYNAQRWKVDYADLPAICAAEIACAELDAFTAAHPDNQN